MNGFGVATAANNLFYCLIGAIVEPLSRAPWTWADCRNCSPHPGYLRSESHFCHYHARRNLLRAMYGGSTTSILLNVPGETASVITCIDGYQMAQKGRAGPALATCAIGSFIAGTIGIFGWSFSPLPWQRQPWPLDLRNIFR